MNKLNINFDQLAEDKGLHRKRLNLGCSRGHEHNLSDEQYCGLRKVEGYFTKQFK